MLPLIIFGFYRSLCHSFLFEKFSFVLAPVLLQVTIQVWVKVVLAAGKFVIFVVWLSGRYIVL